MSMSEDHEGLSPEVWEEICYLRSKSFKRIRKKGLKNLNRPVAFWTKKDRLRNNIGKEFTIILKTKGCSWALGEYGGCSMCGYIQDAALEDIEADSIKAQFDYALEQKKEEIINDKDDYILKIFNSGSFFDDEEMNPEVREYIYESIAKINKIKELVVESRVEYLSSKKLKKIKNDLQNKYIEIGIGLETVDDYIRNRYVNKGLTYKEFLEAVSLCKEHDIGVKAYLLLKPPFLSEKSAIDDAANSIRTLIKLGIETISLNPLNIQKGSLAEKLWYQNRYRPPWYYSLFKCLKKSITQNDLKSVRIVCDPSGAGRKRGIHNCLDHDCNEKMKDYLEKFVFSQDVKYLRKYKNQNREEQCSCIVDYYLKLKFL